MKKSLVIIVSISIILICLDLVRSVWLGKGDAPSDIYTSLLTALPRSAQEPRRNAYLLLLGFSAGPSADPLRVGHEIWLEAESDRGHRPFDYSKESRLELQVAEEIQEDLKANMVGGELNRLRALADPAKNLLAPHALLLDRYRQWLSLPFDDWGAGHPGTPSMMAIYAAHRLYLAEAWSQDTATALDRLGKDLLAWRWVLGNAKTLPLKIFAATMVDEDAALVSDALNLPDFDIRLLPTVDPLVRPLTQAERSLRWPIQNTFTIDVTLFEHPMTNVAAQLQPATDAQERWIAELARMRANAFETVEQPIPVNLLSHAPMQRQRTLNIYAAFCEATIKAADLPNSPFPKLLDMARLTHHRFLDHFVNPIDNFFASGEEPAWAPFADRILRTDARLKLTAVHARLHRTTRDQSVVSRIVQAGPAFYDPFSGFPLLWSAATGKLYSVGEDRGDDGGDEQRDIPILLFPAQAGSSTKP